MKKAKNYKNIIPISLAIVIVLLTSLLGIKRGFIQFTSVLSNDDNLNLLKENWELGNYLELIIISQEILLETPMNPEVIFINGASNFYVALSKFDREEQLFYLDESIVMLRRVLSLKPDTLLEGKSHYLLGKAYFYKGEYYSDLSIQHLKLAMEFSYNNPDIFEYLAESYSLLGNYDESLYYLNNLLENHRNDRILHKIAYNSYMNGDYDRAESFYLDAYDISTDSLLKKEILWDLGNMYFNLKNYREAEKVLSQYLDIDYNNRDAHFMLGEIYNEMGDRSAAIIEWRRAERLDPYYRPVLLRLYN